MRNQRRRHPNLPPEGVIVKDRQVVVYLNLDGANWLASCLPENDGFTRDVLRAADELASLPASAPEEADRDR